MAVSSGFFNGADRPADATDICSIFDGLISDGVYKNVGTVFSVIAAGGNFLNVGPGRAWFNHAWILNDAVEVYEAPSSEVLLNRYDCVVLEVDRSDPVRDGRILILSGTPSSNPSLPVLSNGPLKFQYIISSVYRAAGSTEILQTDITPFQGSTQTPYVKALVERFVINESDPIRITIRGVEVTTSDWTSYTPEAGEETDIKNIGFVFRKYISVPESSVDFDITVDPNSDYELCRALIHRRGKSLDGYIALYARSIPALVFHIDIEFQS